MNKKDIDSFICMIADVYRGCQVGYGMSPATFKGTLVKFTDIMHLKKNKRWQELCFDIDGNAAQEYLQLSPKELLKHNGMSLLKWNTEDISRRDVLKAINAKHHNLTPSAICSNKGIRSKLRNKDIVELAKTNSYGVLTKDYMHRNLPNLFWLRCINKEDTAFNRITGLKKPIDWINYIGLVHYFADRTEHKNFNMFLDILHKLNAPKQVMEYAATLNSYVTRYCLANGKLPSWGKKTNVAFTSDDDLNAEFETYLKMKGYKYHKDWNSDMGHDEHYKENLYALHECLIAKLV